MRLFESYSNSDSQAAFHLHKDSYIAFGQWMSGERVCSKTEILLCSLLNFVQSSNACECVSEVRITALATEQQ